MGWCSARENNMRPRLDALLFLACLAAAGCRTDPNIVLLERENRELEDTIYELQACLDEYQQALDTCRKRKPSSDNDLAGAADTTAGSSRPPAQPVGPALTPKRQEPPARTSGPPPAPVRGHAAADTAAPRRRHRLPPRHRAGGAGDDAEGDARRGGDRDRERAGGVRRPRFLEVDSRNSKFSHLLSPVKNGHPKAARLPGWRPPTRCQNPVR